MGSGVRCLYAPHLAVHKGTALQRSITQQLDGQPPEGYDPQGNDDQKNDRG